MKAVAPMLSAPPLAEARPEISGLARRLAIYATLTKPRIALMVLITVATGYIVGTRGLVYPPRLFGPTDPARLVLTLIGSAMVAGAASTWNQVIERTRDGRMRRTARRPLPLGLVSSGEAAAFGSTLGVLGVGMLLYGVNVTAAAVAATTFVLYVAAYTPLKPLTTLNTAVGAIPGALPPLIGWAAATGGLGVGGWSLFLIVFLWQFPHFLAIAWVHREDYARGGHRMLPSIDPTGLMTGRQAASHALALVPAGLLPAAIGMAGRIYFTGALILGLLYLIQAVRFWLDVSDASARRLMKASFLYLPAVLTLLLLDPPAA